ncbi:MAG TPA: hypothetical protein VFD56_11670, partial [Chitinophagaceae bacterium]|nr:hypothetical protein [Chitinophagaceae bacterium]
MKQIGIALLLANSISVAAKAQSAEELVLRIKEKIEKVSDYEAVGKMKMNVVFIKAPVANVK